ncbi:MAG: cytochrome C [Desulfobacteraceae bacterium]|jgi:cytochrome b subunit of formate dehydrogenase
MMTPTTRIKRFGVIDRVFHLFLILTFLTQTATGFGRLYYTTAWGKRIGALFGGYESSLLVHKWVGIIMLIGFIVHTVFLLFKVDWRRPKASLFGPDSLIPTFRDFVHLGQRIRWFFGLGAAPRIGRWSYWEKFDYWAVYWGMPLLAITGLMLMYPIWTSRWAPGWILNVAALLHRAEAILAAAYIFIVHFFIGHLRPTSFPMNEAMFSGSVPLPEAKEEKPGWVEQMQQQGRLELAAANPPSTMYRVIYFLFGYAALGIGVYLLINGILYSGHIRLH